jgi:hypothetical protein
MSIAELAATAEALKRQQSSIRQKLAAAKRKLIAEQLRPCTPWMRAVSMRLLSLPDSGPRVVQQYLVAKKRRETVADVQGWCDSLTAAEKDQLLAPGSDRRSGRQLAEAKLFFEESRLVHWVQEQNELNGVAPTASAVADRAGPALARQKWRSNRLRWVQQALRRWGGRRVHFAGRSDQLSPEEFRKKVATLLRLASASRGCSRGPKKGAHFGPQNASSNRGQAGRPARDFLLSA